MICLRKLIAWPLAWALYGIGHAVSKCISKRTGFLYPVYNWAMVLSANVSDWAGLDVWGEPSAGER